MRSRFSIIIVVIILAVFAVINITSMKRNSPVYDEVSHHIATGYSFLKTTDFRLNSTQPPLIEEISAIPLLFLKPHLPLGHPSWANIDRTTFGFQFLYRYNKDADRIVFWVKIPMVILSILCGILIFVWARELYGEKAGLFAVFLYAFSPNIIAYSQLVTADLGASFFILLAMYRFYKFLEKPKMRNVFLAGIVLGLAEASKVTALILIPLFFVIVLWRWLSQGDRRFITRLGWIFLICYIIVFLSYFGEIKPLLKNDVDVPEKIGYIEIIADKFFPGNQAIKYRLINFALNTPIPFSTYIMNILSSTNLIFKQSIFKVYLLGKHSQTGWWYYYLCVFLFKTPVPTFILLLIAIVFARRLKLQNRLGEAMLISFPIVFIIVSLLSRLQGGIRYILPFYPFMFIYISKVVNLKIGKRIVANLLIFLLCLWYLTETIRIHPHYISYFNQIAGGPDNGWRCLGYTNIDYGQDLISLADYLKRNNIKEVKLSYSGTADPEYYGINPKDITKKEFNLPQNSVYAISVDSVDTFSWAKKDRPDAKAGYSIFIYDMRNKTPDPLSPLGERARVRGD